LVYIHSSTQFISRKSCADCYVPVVSDLESGRE
jgi:hypothetical protein